MRLLVSLLAASLLPTLAGAATPVDDTHTVAAGGRVELTNVAGAITVRGWDRNEVQLTGTLGDGLTLKQEKSANRVRWEVQYPRRQQSNGDARLELRVPRRALEVQLGSVSADVTVSAVDVRRLQINTVSGAVSAAGRSDESVIMTVSGDIDAQLRTPRLEGRTVSGAVQAGGGVGGELTLASVSGRVGVDAAQVQRLAVETVSGNVDLAASGLAPGGSITVQAVSAPVSLRLPKQVSAKLSVNSFSGAISSDAGRAVRSPHGVGSALETRLGGGDGDIRLESHSGNVRFRLNR